MFATLALLVTAAQFSATPAVTTIPAPRPTPGAVQVLPPRPTDDGAAADVRVARADSLSFAGRLDAAEDLYRAVIREQTDAGRYAKRALWHLATAYDLVGDRGKTARTLDELADAAARFGDPEMELEASFESARLHAALHESRTALDRVQRVHCLMQSPAISESVKADFEARIGDK